MLAAIGMWLNILFVTSFPVPSSFAVHLFLCIHVGTFSLVWKIFPVVLKKQNNFNQITFLIRLYNLCFHKLVLLFFSKQLVSIKWLGFANEVIVYGYYRRFSLKCNITSNFFLNYEEISNYPGTRSVKQHYEYPPQSRKLQDQWPYLPGHHHPQKTLYYKSKLNFSKILIITSIKLLFNVNMNLFGPCMYFWRFTKRNRSTRWCMFLTFLELQQWFLTGAGLFLHSLWLDLEMAI